MARWLAVDHGHKRIGVAVGDTADGFASPVTVLQGGADEQVVPQLAKLAQEYDVAGIVVGWPVNMDDTLGPQAAKARDFAVVVAEATGLDVRLWDERLSSFDADQALAGLMTRKKRKARQDAIAAASFLREFLAQDGPSTAPRPQDV